MKRKDITALHTLTVADLNKKLQEVSEQFAKAKMEKAANKLANTRLVTNLADDIARIKTVLKEKELEQETV